MSPPSPTTKLQKAVWENAARAARRELSPLLSTILGHTVSSSDFISRDEFDAHMHHTQTPALIEVRFAASHRDAVLTRLRGVAGLGTPSKALLWFARSERLGGLRVPRTPTADVVLDLLDWDLDDVFVFDGTDNLIVHVDRGEDWLEPKDSSSREMLYIVNIPMTYPGAAANPLGDGVWR